MKTLVWAHRGASAYAPENTLEAIRLAVEMGSDGVEIDVHRTLDGVIVVSHDGNIERCSNGKGAISEMTYSELVKYNYNKGMDKKYPYCKIPTLAEVYEVLKDTGLWLNVEIKHGGKEFIRDIMECTHKGGMKDRVVYSSFVHEALKDMKEIDPDAFTAPLYGGNEIFEVWNYAISLGCKAVHPHIANVYAIEGYVEKCHQAGIRVHPWTIDDEININNLISLKVDAIITNRPDVVLKCVNK